MFERIAIVNRGEPAMRLIHAVRELRQVDGSRPRTVALHTDAERGAMFVREADEAVRIGPGPGEPAPAVNPYLDHDELERALVASGADAAWVGWGFVAEDPRFAELCERIGVTFVGPSAAVMRKLGEKVGAKLLAEEAGVPVARWSSGPVADVDEAATHADAIGYPLMIKASAGGGGRGIRRVNHHGELAGAFVRARDEAQRSFGDPTLFMERVVADAHHVEVQIIADGHGGVWAPGVRDCTLQRRNQKVIEESASTALTADQEDRLREAASALAREAGYAGAGTVEFLYQPQEDLFAFLEVNTRLQVEHPVTELTTGLDLVALQLHVAAGGRLEGDSPPPSGHAIEVRLNAEDPERGFAPASGRIELLTMPVGPGIRIDTGVVEGDEISPDYDSMVAKIIAYGTDRTHALNRLRRALEQTTVLVEGGTTNRAFLLALLNEPDVIAGDVDTQWLDRLTADGGYRFATRGDVALVAAAIDAYEARTALDRDRFYASAARGRPQADPEVPREVDLRLGGTAYRLSVAQTGPDRYLVATDGVRVLAAVERLRRYERRLRIEDQRFRIVAITQGADRLIEVDGVPHRISQDDAGLVRTPGPSVVVSITVAEGDHVAAGATIAVLESMKMETAVHAPFDGVVTDVLASASVQLDAGAPLLRLEPAGDDEDTPASDEERVTFDDLARADGPGPQDAAAAVDVLYRLVLGYDVPDDRIPRLLEVLEASGDDTDRDLFRAELRVLHAYADVASLSRNRRLGDEEDLAESHSAREYLHAFLRSLDADAEALPESFRAKLRRALAHHGVTSLERSQELEEALFRTHLAQQRTQAHLTVVLALLQRRLRNQRPEAGELADELRDTLDRVIQATQVRQPVVGDLARRARYRCFDQPRLERQRAETYARVREHLEVIADPDAPDRDERMTELVATPEPLLGLLEDQVVSEGGLAPMLELLTRRYYRTRQLESVRSVDVPGRNAVVADFVDPRGRGRVIAVSATAEDLSEALAVAGELTTDLPDDAEAGAAADIYLTWSDAPTDLDVLAAGLEADLDAAGLPEELRRVTLSVTVTPGDSPDEIQRPSVEHLTFRRETVGYRERRHLRGIHPLVAGRLDLWRFENFRLTRLPTADDGVYLFHATARENPEDVRLFALAEVRDLTAHRGPDGEVTALPELEQVLAACLDHLRQARATYRPDELPDWNRVVLNVWPVVDVPVAELEPVIRRLAGTTDGLGLEQVTVYARIATPDGDARPVMARMSRPPGQGFTLRITEPATEPLQPFDETAHKIMRARRRGGIYPYELVPLITRDGDPSAPAPDESVGVEPSFVEYDLDAAGELTPVDRPPGGNTAGMVIGVVRTRTPRYPEGMKRVAILGDPTRGLGSIGEGEGRRVLAALDLAESLDVPVEWFAVSSGARIAMDSGTENMDWIGRVLRRIIEFTQDGREINIVVAGINVGGQPYWNAEATMLMHTRGILVMTPDSAMVLTGKQALDYSGGVSAEDNFGIGGYDRVMGPNGQAQYWAPDLAAACDVLFAHYAHAYVAPGERFPRPSPSNDPVDRDVRDHPHDVEDVDFTTVGEIFSESTNPGRKKPFDIRTVIRSVADLDHEILERWRDMADAGVAVVCDAHLGGTPVTIIGVESRPLPRRGPIPADGPDRWTAGTLFPRGSKKVARGLNAASGVRPAVVLANLSGFDGSPESLRELQLEYGAEIGRAVVNFDGPIVFCVISRYHGGAFVVFSKTLNEDLEVAAVEGSHASVIGGQPAAAVVFAGEVNARTDRDERVAALREALDDAGEADVAAVQARLEQVRADVRSEKLGEVAAEFDAVHSIERAQRVGSVDEIVPAARLRPYLVEAVRRGIDRVEARPRR